MINPWIEVLMDQYNTDIQKWKLEIRNYLDNPVAVAGHANVIETLDGLVVKLSEAEDKLVVLETSFTD